MLSTVVPIDMPAVNTIQCCSTVNCQERKKWPICNLGSCVRAHVMHIKHVVCTLRR